ncbi:acylphosphatase [Microbacterium barkeri]|uniref:acylphosphatase n=1 Tax=Microbacterium barkeri TaxID=33917 RepID=A0A9W6LXP5_9MICO|nr:acylphosphatase [Microbacterium barkeri]MDR6878037.1 acylphosphatase [Microbacterium barkeri]GLJ63099.1 acylphosphatase [Microbacterium barkeri]
MRRVRVVVEGVVQGVGFRWSTARQAERRDVVGWVRNAGADRVEAELEGGSDAVDAVVDWMRQGPTGSRVDDIAIEEIAPTGATAFELRPSV